MKNDKKFPILETTRLKLRKPLQKDAIALLQTTQDDDVMKQYGMSPFRNKAEALAEIQWFNKLFTLSEGIRWVITQKGAGNYLGDIGFHNYVIAHSRAEIGFKLAKAFWHQGIMTEALEQVLEYGFRVMQFNRIEAVTDPENAA